MLLVDLKGAGGCISGDVIDYRMSSTATEDTTCQIVHRLPVWNEFLCCLRLKLVELPESGRKHGLVRVPAIHAFHTTQERLHQVTTLLDWLLKMHRCVASLLVTTIMTHGSFAETRRALIWRALEGNCSIKSLTFEDGLKLSQQPEGLLNTSITQLGIGDLGYPSAGLARLGDVVRQSVVIRLIYLLEWLEEALDLFIQRLHFRVSMCYSLCGATWRIQYSKSFDRVYRHPALMAELAEVLSIDEGEAREPLGQRFRSIEGLHDFMRLTGVVQERVTCLPSEDGSTQLDALDDDCWSHVRRYLQLDDVALGSASLAP
ncbi:hypothetical protein MTO96_020032 [Rhipicephalus appendiculatus]